MNEPSLFKEFDRQLNNLIAKGYPQLAGLNLDSFLSQVSLLKPKLKNLDVPDIDLEKGVLPFVVVVKDTILSVEQMMGLVEKDGKQGVTVLRPHTSEDFKVIDFVSLPNSDFYLVVNIDRGKDNINEPPNVAINSIKSKQESPLTICEGVAIVTHFPEFLIKNNCFSLLGSRTGKDQRVPAIWINSMRQPNLGWCWDGNPHTWLGSASCQKRLS